MWRWGREASRDYVVWIGGGHGVKGMGGSTFLCVDENWEGYLGSK